MATIRDILARLESPDDETVRDSLGDVDDILTSRMMGTEKPTPEELRAIERGLVSLIDSDPRGDLAPTAIWQLGKLFDPALEGYLAVLLASYLDDDDLGGHLYQTAIALDNLEAFGGEAFTPGTAGLPHLRGLTLAYLEHRRKEVDVERS